MKHINLLRACAAAVLLTACGGGNSAPTPVAAPAPAPVANRAPDASATTASSQAEESATISLSATGSSDADGDTLSYSWTQTDGPVADIASPEAATTDVTFPSLDLDDTATFRLSVSDGTASDTADVTVSVLNTTDPADAQGVLTFKTQGTPVAFTGNIRNSSDTDAEFLYIEELEDGTVQTVYYRVDGAGDGPILQGTPQRKSVGVDDFGPDVEIYRGYFQGTTGYDIGFFAVEPDRIRFLHDPEFDPDLGVAEDAPDRQFEVGVDIRVEDTCVLPTWNFTSPYTRFPVLGDVLVGSRNGGASIFRWSRDMPETVTEIDLDQTKSYCGVTVAPSNSRLATGLSTTVAMLDVDARVLDLYAYSRPFQVQPDNDTLSISLERSVDLSSYGIEAGASWAGRFENIHLYSRGEAADTHQALVIFNDVLFDTPPGGVRDLAGLSTFVPTVVTVEGSLPTGMRYVPNAPDSAFHVPGTQANRLILFAQPDMNRVAVLPYSTLDLTSDAVVYQDVGETELSELFPAVRISGSTLPASVNEEDNEVTLRLPD